MKEKEIRKKAMWKIRLKILGFIIAGGLFTYIGYLYCEENNYDKITNIDIINIVLKSGVMKKRINSKNETYYLKISRNIVAKSPRAKFKLCQIPKSCHIVTKIYSREKLLKTGISFSYKTN